MAEQEVKVRWVKDGPPEGFMVNGRLYPSGKGPVRQRQALSVGGPHSLETEGVDVELAPGEEATFPAEVAQAIVAAGYAEPVEQARASRAAAARRGR
jgi:hypothetical protein